MNTMKLMRIVSTASVFLLTSPQTFAADAWVGMVTGSKTGTYIKVGQDITDSARKHVDIRVKESGGSIDNIKRMNSKENAAFGIVQSDVLGYMQRSNDPNLVKVANRLRMVFPLYNEEVHVFANKRIQKLSDLHGGTVSVGNAGGGSWMTATNIFKILGIQPAQIYNWDKTKAAASVIDGKLDAMIYVAGKPVTFFEKVGTLENNPEYADRFKNVHFVEVSEPAIKNEYAVSSIGKRDYPWVDKTIGAVAVKAMMVSYDFSSRYNAYYDKRCTQLGHIKQSINESIGQLKSNGRTPKWKEVDLNASIGSWKRDTCSTTSKSGSGNPSTENKLMEALGL